MKVPTQLRGSHSSVSVLLLLLLGGGDRGTVYRGKKQTTDSPDHTGTVQFRWEGGTRVRRSSVTVKFNRVD